MKLHDGQHISCRQQKSIPDAPQRSSQLRHAMHKVDNMKLGGVVIFEIRSQTSLPKSEKKKEKLGKKRLHMHLADSFVLLFRR